MSFYDDHQRAHAGRQDNEGAEPVVYEGGYDGQGGRPHGILL